MKFEALELWYFYVACGLAVLALAYYGIQTKSFKKSLIFALKVLACLLIAASVFNPVYERFKSFSDAILLLDVSGSIDSGVAQDLLTRARELESQGIGIKMLPFAKKSLGLPLALPGSSSYQEIRGSFGALDTGGTDLEAALQTLKGYQNAKVLLISDGFSTQGDETRALSELATGAVSMFPLTKEVPTNFGEFSIVDLNLPLLAAAQKSVDIRVTVRNTTKRSQAGTLQVKHSNKIVYQREIQLAAGSEQQFLAKSDPTKEGIGEVQATLTPLDKATAPSDQIAYLSSEEREKVLMVEGASEDGQFLREVLKEQRYKLTSVEAAGAKESFAELKSFKSVIFNNVALNQLPSGTDRLVEQYINDGGGFIMLGGPRSFGLGGYKDTAIESAMPLDFQPPQTEQKRLNIALELVLDKSKSMAEGEKLEFAKEAAREVVRKMKDDDLVGVMGFDTAPFEIVRLGQLANIREQALERIGRLFPAGKTNLMPAMDEARRRLEVAPAGRKHMIVLTDGQVPDGGPYYIEMAKQLRYSGITLSTIMLGAESDLGLLQSMGEAGGGGYYQVTDPRSLPSIFLRDIKISTGEKTMKEQQDFPVRAGPDDIVSTSVRNFPPLRGYVQTRKKDRATLELVTLVADKAEPLLASWSYGKGRAIAFTSDASGRWSNYWVSWPKFQMFWGELVEASETKSESAGASIDYDLKHYLKNGSLFLDFTVYNHDLEQALEANLSLPSSKDTRMEFEKISAGHYIGRLDQPLAGKYVFNARVGEQALTAAAFNLSPELFGEKKWQGFNLPLLNELADRSGGKLNPDANELKSESAGKLERVELKGYFIGLALVLLMLEIALREGLLRMRTIKILPTRRTQYRA